MNLIPNGEFLSLKGWTPANNPLVVLERVEGIPCVKLSADPAAAEGTESTFIEQMLDIHSLEAKSEYRMQFRAKSDHFPQLYNLYLATMRGDRVVTAIGYEWRQLGGGWQDVKLDFRDVNTDATAAKVVIQVKAPGQVWIADLRVEKLPAGTIGAEERQLKDLPRYVGSPKYVQITSDRRFIVNGKPFFPIGQWDMAYPDEKAMDDMQECGYNVTGSGMLIDRGPDGVKTFLDQAQARNLHVLGLLRYDCFGEASAAVAVAEQRHIKHKPILDVTREHPAFFVYDIADEPGWIGNSLSAFAAGAHFIRQNDPNHPIFSNQAPRGIVSLLQRWYRFVDVGGCDIYPWWNGEPDRHSDLPDKSLSVVGAETVKNLKALGARKPALMTVQGFGWSDHAAPEMAAKGYGYPPYNIQRYMVYDAIVNGATGILVFQDQRYPGVINMKIKPLTLELKALHDVLASPTEAGYARSSDKRVKLITKKHQGQRTVIAVNRSDRALSCQISHSDNNQAWQERSSHRRLKSMEQGFIDHFDAWGVNIYEQQ